MPDVLESYRREIVHDADSEAPPRSSTAATSSYDTSAVEVAEQKVPEGTFLARGKTNMSAPRKVNVIGADGEILESTDMAEVNQRRKKPEAEVHAGEDANAGPVRKIARAGTPVAPQARPAMTTVSVGAIPAPTHPASFEFDVGVMESLYHDIYVPDSRSFVVLVMDIRYSPRYFPKASPKPFALHLPEHEAIFLAEATDIQFNRGNDRFCVIKVLREGNLAQLDALGLSDQIDGLARAIAGDDDGNDQGSGGRQGPHPAGDGEGEGDPQAF